MIDVMVPFSWKSTKHVGGTWLRDSTGDEDEDYKMTYEGKLYVSIGCVNWGEFLDINDGTLEYSIIPIFEI